MVVALGRFQIASHAVEDAARSAARQASIARTAEAAQQQAHGAAVQTLSAQSLQCDGMDVAVDTSALAKAPGETAHLTATVRCSLSLSQTALPGIPGQRLVERTFTSPVDTYRE
ncbi:hypothetical protein [Streptomonospora salina]|uniref:hypothetical protein n=1 Tax=Streptomonospora salina TaxID=104205 RepID=UPI0036DB0B2D